MHYGIVRSRFGDEGMSTEDKARRTVATGIQSSDESEALLITWDDNHTGVYPWGYLRGACPCVLCKRDHRGVDIEKIEAVEGVWLIDWMAVGNYAIRLLWSDAHETGIYDFDYLREICRCGECLG